MSRSNGKKKKNEVVQQEEQYIQLQHLQNFMDLVRNQNIQHALRLSKQKTITIGKDTYNKKPLSARQWREIVSLNEEMSQLTEGSLAQADKLIELRTKGAEYYFGIPSNVFEDNYETISPIIEGCILRSNTGLSPDIDIDKLVIEYQKQAQIVS